MKQIEKFIMLLQISRCIIQQNRKIVFKQQQLIQMRTKLPLQLNKCLTRTRSSSLIKEDQANPKYKKDRIRTRQQQRLTDLKNSNNKKRIKKRSKLKNYQSQKINKTKGQKTCKKSINNKKSSKKKILKENEQQYKFEKKIQIGPYKKTRASRKESIKIGLEICSICWDDKNICSVLPCTHRFHKKCINDWLKQQNSCPECRTHCQLSSVKQN